MPSNTRKNDRVTKTRSRSSRLTCAHCRSKKIRCDGGQPSCGICIAYKKPCHYDKPPSMTQVFAMTERIRELESKLEENSSQAGSTDRLRADDNDISHSGANDEMAVVVDEVNPVHTSPHEDDDLTAADAYFDTTSAVHPPFQSTPNALKTPVTQPSTVPAPTDQQHTLQPDDVLLYEDHAIHNCSIILNLAPEKIRHLLETHWTWVHPMFLFVDRFLFLRDAAAGGPFFTPLLLAVICLHSTRFTDNELADRLFTHVKLLAGQEIHADTPSIPRVQAFLQLSAHEIGRGSLSAAWTYSGIAFRTALDLGLFANKLPGHERDAQNAEDSRRQAIGRRLAWSCYLWDKTLSLYLGRTPTLSMIPDSMEYVERIGDNNTWKPYGVWGKSPSASLPTPSYTQECFYSFCKLGVIINDILLRIYGRQEPDNIRNFVQNTRTRLQSWHNELPDTIRLGPNVVVCPNAQILTQNLLYRTTTILLLRPFRKAAMCRAECRDAANAIENLFLALERTFGFTRVTYLMAYCAYIGATVAVQDARDHVADATRKVETFTRVLSALRHTCPGVQLSLDIIERSMSSSSSVAQSGQQQLNETENSAFDICNMPAFPINGFAADTNVTYDHLTTYPDLDAYTFQWSTFPDDVFGENF